MKRRTPVLYLSISMLALLTGFLLDICFGDPHWLPHPVRWMGALISVLEKSMKGCFQKSKAVQRFAGVCLVRYCDPDFHRGSSGNFNAGTLDSSCIALCDCFYLLLSDARRQIIKNREYESICSTGTTQFRRRTKSRFHDCWT